MPDSLLTSGQRGPRGSLGGVWEAPKTEEVFSEGLGKVLGGLGVVLLLWDGPWVGPGKWKCCHFIDNTDVLAMRVLFCFFLRQVSF